MRGRSGSVLGRMQYGDTRSRGDGHHYSQPGRWAAGAISFGLWGFRPGRCAEPLGAGQIRAMSAMVSVRTNASAVELQRHAAATSWQPIRCTVTELRVEHCRSWITITWSLIMNAADLYPQSSSPAPLWLTLTKKGLDPVLKILAAVALTHEVVSVEVL